jgi:hypothetical protein
LDKPHAVSLHFVPSQFVPGHIVPVVLSPSTLRPLSVRSLVILPPGHFVPWSFRPRERETQSLQNANFYIPTICELLQALYNVYDDKCIMVRHVTCVTPVISVTSETHVALT